MRRLIATLALAAGMTLPAWSQQLAFSPYLAVKERWSLAQAEEAIVATYGSIKDRRPYFLRSKPTEGLEILVIDSNGVPGFFILCHGIAAGYSAPVDPMVAAVVIDEESETPHSTRADARGLTLLYDDSLLVMYQIAGTLPAHVNVTYAVDVFNSWDATWLCDGYR